MTVVEHHESKSEWWTASAQGWHMRMESGCAVTIQIQTANARGEAVSILLPPSRWPAIRDAIDALYRIWDESRETPT